MKDEDQAIAEMIASYLRARRNELGLTQTQVAEKAGLGFRTVQRIESAEFVPDGKSLLKMSRALSCYFFFAPKESDEDLVEVMRHRWQRSHTEN